MAISAFQAGVNTVSATNINLDRDTLTDGDIIIWDSAGNYFVNARPSALSSIVPQKVSDLTNDSNFVTQSQLTSQITAVNSGGGVDLSTYATIAYVDNQITNNVFDGDYNSLTNLPTIPTAFSGDYNDLTNQPNLFSGDYDDLINKPTIFSGNYNDLVNQPNIPSLDGYATETYVQNQISLLADNDSQTLTLSGTDLSISGGNQIDVSTLQQTLSLSGTTLTISGTNGNVVDLSTFSSIASSSVTQLADVDTTGVSNNQVLRYNSTSGNWEPHTLDVSDLLDNTGLLFSGSYTDLTNKPNIPNDLLDLNITDGTPGQVLKTNGLGYFYFADEEGAGNSPGIQLSALSVSQGGATGGGSLAYNSANGVFTFRPADLTNLVTSAGLTSTLANYVTQSSLNAQIADFIDLEDISIGTDAPASGAGSIAYNNTTGVFTYTPPDLSGYSTFSGSYADLTNKPTIPTDVSDLTDTTNLLSGGGGSYANSDVDTHLNTSSATANQILSWNGTDYQWVTDQTGGGGGGNSPFTWTTAGTDNELRVATGWSEGGNSYTIRQASINSDNLFEVELASFSPVVTASGQGNLYWDQTATQFSVSVDNPTDFTTRHIDEVASITGATGVHTTLSDYTTSGPSATPAGGVDWNQTFTTNSTATIVSNGSGTSGGSASATITWNDDDSNAWTQTRTISYNWLSANVTINMSNLSGKNFLEQYNNTSYTVSVSGLASSSNASSTVTPSGGTVSSSSGSGTFTFTTPVHKDNNDGTRTVAVSTVFSRPEGVTGTAYTVTDTASDTSISSNFSYPSFHIFTVDSSTPPTKAEIVDGNNFDSAVTELSNQTRQIDTTINNSDSNPRCFWFGVRTSATQPTTFESGPSNALLSGVSVTTGNTVDLGPDTTPSGYTEEGYTLYGITLQPGNTYVRIS